MRNRRLHRRPAGCPLLLEGLTPAGVPRLRLGRGCRARRRDQGGQAGRTGARDRRTQAVHGQGRHRPHPRRPDLPANQVNAHPHLSADGKVAVVHNGIIDNAASLREALADDSVEMISDTDSEVLAHLVARSDEDTLEAKVRAALAQIDGTYGVAVLHEHFPDRIVVARNGSPLIIGVGEKEMHVASDLQRSCGTPPPWPTSTTASWPSLTSRRASRRTPRRLAGGAQRPR